MDYVILCSVILLHTHTFTHTHREEEEEEEERYFIINLTKYFCFEMF